MRNVGDKVWVARFENHSPDYVTCPDCGGEGRIRCIMHDESIVSVDCRCCENGYYGPKGKILIYRQNVRTELADITGYEVEGDKVKYKVSGHYIHHVDTIFDDEASALAYGLAEQEKYQQEQKERIAKKEKDARSWSWNASYHRRCIKDAQKQIEYHTAKLNVASLKAKEKAA